MIIDSLDVEILLPVHDKGERIEVVMHELPKEISRQLVPKLGK